MIFLISSLRFLFFIMAFFPLYLLDYVIFINITYIYILYYNFANIDANPRNQKAY